MGISVCKHLWVEIGEGRKIAFCDSCGLVEVMEVSNA